MFKWFAPLMLFAAKPDVAVRIVMTLIAVAVLAFGVWLSSNIALTLNQIKNPYIMAAYGFVLFCLFAVVGLTAWMRVRRQPEQKPALSKPLPEVPLATELVKSRAAEISGKWERGERPADSRRKAPARLVPAAAAPLDSQQQVPPRGVSRARASLLVTGPDYTGKTTLIAVLAGATRAAAPQASETVRLVDAGPSDGEAERNAELAAAAAAANGILFVVDQDLRAPETATIKSLAAVGKPLCIVLNKADQYSAADRDAILVSIRAKLPEKVTPGFVVSVAGAPSPVEREIEDARGAVRVELRRPSPDVRALTALLARAFPPPAGRTLRFEAG